MHREYWNVRRNRIDGTDLGSYSPPGVNICYEVCEISEAHDDIPASPGVVFLASEDQAGDAFNFTYSEDATVGDVLVHLAKLTDTLVYFDYSKANTSARIILQDRESGLPGEELVTNGILDLKRQMTIEDAETFEIPSEYIMLDLVKTAIKQHYTSRMEMGVEDISSYVHRTQINDETKLKIGNRHNNIHHGDLGIIKAISYRNFTVTINSHKRITE